MPQLFKQIFFLLMATLAAGAATTSCDLDWSAAIGLRVDIEDSGGFDIPDGEDPEDYGDCGGSNSDIQNPTASAELKDGIECGDYVLAVTVSGSVEDQNSGFDYVYVNGILFFSGRNNGGGCAMHSATETRQITVKATDPIVLEYDTVDANFHEGAYAQITNIALISGPGCNDGACSTCGSAGGGSAGNSSVDVRISLGEPELGKYPGMFRIKTESPDASIYNTAAIEYGVDIDADVEAIRDGSGAIRQVLTNQVLADVVTVSPHKYQILFYYASEAGTQVSGLYVPTGSAYKVWTLEDPDSGTGSDYRFKVTETVDGVDTVHDYEWVPANQDWTLVNAGIKEIGRKKATVNGNRVETYWLKEVGGSESLRRDTTYQSFAWGDEVISETLDPLNPAESQTTSYTYYTDAGNDGFNYKELKLMESPSGYWKRYEYDSLGRVIKTVSPVGDALPTAAEADCRVIERIYQTSTPQETRIETRLGQEVSRSYTIHSGNVTRSIQAATPGAAWDATGNLETRTTKLGGSSEFKEKIAYIAHPDGTLTRYQYSRDAATGAATTIQSSGAPNSSKTAVIDGQRRTIVEDALGQLVTETVMDIASNLTLSFKAVTDSDALGRPLRIDYLDGTYETFAYSCCGLGTHVDREGIATSYFYDALKRKTGELRNGITDELAYNASDRVVEQARVGTDSTRIVLAASAYSSSGRKLWQQDALGFKRNYSYGNAVGGGELVTITHQADGSTQTESYLRDGNLVELEGDSVAPRKYAYGVDSDGSTWTQEILIGAGGSETEWVRNYANMLGQSIRTEYADSAATTYGYNNLGQLIRQTDADGVQVLFAHNATGQRTVQAVDLNRNGIIDFGGIDRIERSLSEVVDVSGSTLIRESSERWETEGTATPTLYATSERSPSGLQSSRTVHGQTQLATTTYDGSGGRTEVSISPAGVTSIRGYTQGHLIEAKTLDSNDQLIKQTTYFYDPHGRLSSETLGGTGTTTYTYTSGDQIATIMSRDPDSVQEGAGFDPQITQYDYNNRGWLTRVTHPDLAETHTSYYPTGKIKRTWGARTYPVEYNYDPQQRVASMETWKDFEGTSGSALTEWNYHPQRGWLTSKEYADGNGPTYIYTDAGRLLSRTWARGITTNYSHENGGEVASVTYSDGTPTVAYTHGRTGEIETISDAAGLLTLSRTNGQLLDEAYTGSGLLTGKSLSRTVDSFNRINGLSATSTASVSLTYDDASRLAALTQGNRVASYIYEGTLGVIAQVKIETDGTERYRLNREHDRLGRVTRIDTHGNETTLHTRRDYTHNAANQRTVVREEDEQAWHFDYDSLGQVIKAKKTVSGSEEAIPGYAFEFSFDNIGNRTNATSNGRTADYTSDALNRYTQRDFPGAVDVRGHAPEKVGVIVNGERTARTDGDFYAEATADNSAASVEMDITVKAVDPGPPELLAQENRSVVLPETPEAFTHDLDGNLIQDGLWTYEWDAENRLIEMESRTDLPASVTRQRLEFAYDGRSRRIAKTVKEYDSAASAWTTTKQVNFLYDGWNLLAEYDVLNSQALLRSHVWGVDLSGSPQGAGGVGGLLWTTQAANAYAPGFDANGNIIAWIDLSDGTLAGTSEYGAFGETLVKSGVSADLPFGFSTKYEDSETCLLYYGFRYYDAETGRWPSRDPIEEWGGLNLYGFVRNNPIRYVDNLGNSIVETIPGLIGVRPPSVWDDYDGGFGAPSEINTLKDLNDYYRSGAGGSVPAGQGLYDNMRSNSSYQGKVLNVNSTDPKSVIKRVKDKLKQQTGCEGTITNASGSTVGLGSWLGSYQLEITYSIEWTRSGGSMSGGGNIDVNAQTIHYKLNEEWDYEWEAGQGIFNNVVRGWAAGLIVGDGIAYNVTGDLSETYTFRVNAN